MSDPSPRPFELGILTEPLADTANLVLVDEGEVGRKRGRLGIVFWLAVFWLALMVFFALFANFLHLPDPNSSLGGIAEKPSSSHWLGTDQIGRDMLSRVIYGTRITLVVGVFAIVFGMLVGGPIGLCAGYFRGRVEVVLMSITDILLAFPSLVFALAVITFMGRSVIVVTLTIGVLSIAPLARVVRGSTLVYSQREFVLASRTLGAPSKRILFREVLPNVVPAGLSFALIGVATAMVAEAALSFLGLSVSAEHPTWGGLINAGYEVLSHHPLVAIIPATFLFLTVLSLNFAGDALRQMFDIKEAAV